MAEGPNRPTDVRLRELAERVSASESPKFGEDERALVELLAQAHHAEPTKAEGAVGTRGRYTIRLTG